MNYVVITENPAGFWYEGLVGSCFSVRPAGSDWRECEGMGPYEQADCLEVSEGEYKGNIILKKHCVVVMPPDIRKKDGVPTNDQAEIPVWIYRLNDGSGFIVKEEPVTEIGTFTLFARKFINVTEGEGL